MCPRERQHETDTRNDASSGTSGTRGARNGSLEIRSGMSQDPHAGAHQDEREQRTDVDPGPEQL